MSRNGYIIPEDNPFLRKFADSYYFRENIKITPENEEDLMEEYRTVIGPQYIAMYEHALSKAMSTKREREFEFLYNHYKLLLLSGKDVIWPDEDSGGSLLSDKEDCENSFNYYGYDNDDMIIENTAITSISLNNGTVSLRDNASKVLRESIVDDGDPDSSFASVSGCNEENPNDALCPPSIPADTVVSTGVQVGIQATQQELHLVKYIIGEGLSKNSISTLNLVLFMLGCRIPLNVIYNNVTERIFSTSMLSSLRSFCVFCFVCNDFIETCDMYCPYCNHSLIKYCPKCHPSKKAIPDVKPTSEASPRCNHHDRVYVNPTYTIYSPEGALIEMWLAGTIQRNVGYRPEEAIAIARYCKSTGTYNPFVSNSAISGWEGINHREVVDEIKQCKHTLDPYGHFSSSISELNCVDSPERAVYNLYLHNEIKCQLYNKELTSKVLNADIKDLKGRIEQFPLPDIVNIEDTMDILLSTHELESLRALYNQQLDSFFSYYTTNTLGLIDRIQVIINEKHKLVEKATLLKMDKSTKLLSLCKKIDDSYSLIHKNYTALRYSLLSCSFYIRTCEYYSSFVCFRNLVNSRYSWKEDCCQQCYEETMSYVNDMSVITKHCGILLSSLSNELFSEYSDYTTTANTFWVNVKKRCHLDQYSSMLKLWLKNSSLSVNMDINSLSSPRITPITLTYADKSIMYAILHKTDNNNALNSDLEQIRVDEEEVQVAINNAIEHDDDNDCEGDDYQTIMDKTRKRVKVNSRFVDTQDASIADIFHRDDNTENEIDNVTEKDMSDNERKYCPGVVYEKEKVSSATAKWVRSTFDEMSLNKTIRLADAVNKQFCQNKSLGKVAIHSYNLHSFGVQHNNQSSGSPDPLPQCFDDGITNCEFSNLPSILVQQHAKKPEKVVYLDTYSGTPDETYLIPLIIFHDGIETYSSSLNQSVYVISAMIVGSLSSTQFSPLQTFTVATIRKTDKSSSHFRGVLGKIIERVDSKGAKGFFFNSDGKVIKMHYYIHGFGGDMLAFQLLVDKAGAHASNVPCCICSSTLGFFDTYCFQYRKFTDSVQQDNGMMRSTCRALLQFPPGCVFRLLPAISILANHILYPRHNENSIIASLSQLANTTFSNDEKDVICSMIRVCRLLGPDFIMITPVESGLREFEYVELDYEQDLENEYSKRKGLVRLPLVMRNFQLDQVYGVDILHETANIVKEIVNFSFSKMYSKDESKFFTDFVDYYFNPSDVNLLPNLYGLPKSTLQQVKIKVELFEYSGLYKWVSKKVILNCNLLLSLKSYHKLLYGFCLYPYFYMDCFDNPFVYLNVVILQIVSLLFNFDGNLSHAYDLHVLLVITLACLEGVVPYNYPTVSYHYMLHLFQSIKQFGCLKDYDTRYTEDSYRIEKKNNLPSFNTNKTLDDRMLLRNYYEIHAHEYIQSVERKLKEILKVLQNGSEESIIDKVTMQLESIKNDLQSFFAFEHTEEQIRTFIDSIATRIDDVKKLIHCTLFLIFRLLDDQDEVNKLLSTQKITYISMSIPNPLPRILADERSFVELTKRNYIDNIVFSHVNRLHVDTGVGLYTKNFSLPENGLYMGDYLPDNFWSDVNFSKRGFHQTVTIDGDTFHSLKDGNDVWKSNKGFGFIRNDDGNLLLFVIKGFVSLKIKGKDFIQAICTAIPTKSILGLVNTLCVRFLDIDDVLNPDLEKTFIIPINRYYNKDGVILKRQETNDSKDNAVFLSMKTNIFQSKELSL